MNKDTSGFLYYYLHRGNFVAFLLIILIFVILVLSGMVSCSAEKGHFGFGSSRHKIRAYKSTPVFMSNQEMYWAYQVKGNFTLNLFGVKLERNELRWLHIETVSLKADPEFAVLSMKYPPMKPGLYRITIYHKQKVLDIGHFRLVSPEDFR